MPDPTIRIVLPRVVTISIPDATKADKTGGTLIDVQSFSMRFPDGTIHKILPRKIGSTYTLDVDPNLES